MVTPVFAVPECVIVTSEASLKFTTSSLKVTVKSTLVALVGPVVEGTMVLAVGDGSGATLNVALGPAATAVLPTVSVAVLAAMLMPNVPVPEIVSMVTVGVVVVPLETDTVPVASPVVFNVISPLVRFTVSAPV